MSVSVNAIKAGLVGKLYRRLKLTGQSSISLGKFATPVVSLDNLLLSTYQYAADVSMTAAGTYTMFVCPVNKRVRVMFLELDHHDATCGFTTILVQPNGVAALADAVPLKIQASASHMYYSSVDKDFTIEAGDKINAIVDQETVHGNILIKLLGQIEDVC